MHTLDLSVPGALRQRGSGFPAGIRAGLPSPPGQCLPRREPDGGLCLPRLHLPQTQVLGQERRGRTQRDHHTRAAQVSLTSFFIFLFRRVFTRLLAFTHRILMSGTTRRTRGVTRCAASTTSSWGNCGSSSTARWRSSTTGTLNRRARRRELRNRIEKCQQALK